MPRTGEWKMSLATARRLSLAAQGFADKRPTGRVNRRHLKRAMSRMQVLQLDSIPVIIRTQYLPLHARLGPYETTLLDRVAYEDDAWFEAWTHEASLIPVASEPLFRWAKARTREGLSAKHLHKLVKDEPAYVDAVLAEVRERGAVKGGELSDPRPWTKRGNGWWHRSMGVRVLDWLFRVGELGIRRRGNFEKVFSPLDAIVPAEILAQPTPDPIDAQRTLVERSLVALGVGTARDVADYFRLPIRDVRKRLQELNEHARVVSAKVEGWDEPAFADPNAKVPKRISGATVLSPFDPVVWNRDRLLRLHGMEYRIEIYVPKDKRRYGYYVLPVMVNGRIVARIDAKTHRAKSNRAGASNRKNESAKSAQDETVLEVRGAWAEPCFEAKHVAPVRRVLDDLATLVGAERWEVCPNGDLAERLG